MFPKRIETSRLLLRPFQFSDVDDVLGYANDEQWSAFLPVPYPYTQSDAETFIAQKTLENVSKERTWAIEYKGHVIGGINTTLDLPNRCAELGWSIARQHWNKGYATESAQAVRDVSFRTYSEINRIEARAFAENQGSIRVMEKINMTKEGCLRQNKVIKDQIHDEVWHSILRDEWNDRSDENAVYT